MTREAAESGGGAKNQNRWFDYGAAQTLLRVGNATGNKEWIDEAVAAILERAKKPVGENDVFSERYTLREIAPEMGDAGHEAEAAQMLSDTIAREYAQSKQSQTNRYNGSLIRGE